MSDLGSDAGSTSLSLMAKAMEALLKLFEKVFEAIQRAPERKLKKIELQEAKSKEERREALKKLDGKVGEINHNLLVKSGVPRTVCSIHLTKDEMKDFAMICKREGIVFAAVTNQQLKKDGEKAFYGIECRTDDLERIKKAVDRFNDEKRINRIDTLREEILSKGNDNLTEQDRIDLTELDSQKVEIQRRYCKSMNREVSQAVVEKAVTGETKRGMTIEEALDRNTGRSIDKDQFCIVADAKDPSKYIKCHGYMDTYKKKSYIKTDYEVYQGSKLVFATHDGKFDGRPQHYWHDQRAKIAETGQFSGVFLKFYNEAEYQKWAKATKEQNITELHEMEKPKESKDYEEIKKTLHEQLDKNGASLKDGVVVDKASEKPLILSPDMNEDQKIVVAESITIGNQIKNYETIERLQGELSIANALVLTTDEGTMDHEEALQQQSDAQDKYNAALNRETELLTERKNINAVQVEHQNAPERIADREAEKQDTRRDERVDEHDNKQMSMQEAKGKIEQEKAKNGAKGADIADKEVHKQVKIPKDKSER